MQLNSLVVLVNIDGVTRQAAIPANHMSFFAKSVLVTVESLEGTLVPCTWVDIQPFKDGVAGFPITLEDSRNETNKDK